MKNSILQVLSVDEIKVSALILLLIMLGILTAVECVQSGDVPANLKDLLEFLIAAIAGINIIGRGFGSKGGDSK